ncbi:hypothetical protein FDECE_8965 [Fusarium decemcellulare]|nr:hypothetical protein FDECE_8965 [Fusarium decemcellulare]
MENQQVEKRLPSPVGNEVDSNPNSDLQWTEQEERALVRKVDLLIMPLLILGFFALQLDRGNIGNALTDFFLRDVGITQNQFNVGQQLLSVGIILLETWSDSVDRRPDYRVIQGICCYFSGLPEGTGPLFRYKAALGLEGLFTILVGIAFLLTFPQQVSNPVSLLRVRYFDERETQILVERVLRDDPSKAVVRHYVSRDELKAALTNWRLLPHLGLTIAGLAPASAFNSYAPTLTTGFGFDRLESNALVSIAYWVLLFFILFWGWVADRLRMRGPVVTIGLAMFWAFNVANRSLIESDNAVLRFAILASSIAISWPWHPINGSWLSLNTKSAGERSVTMAMHIMAANCSGIIGTQLFRSEDAPVYRRGWTAIVCLSSAAVLFSLLANLQYYLGNGRRLHRQGLTYSY